MYNRDEIVKFNEMRYKNNDHYSLAILSGEILKDEPINFDIFEEGCITEVNYEDDYFYQLNIARFENKLLLEFIKLGDEDGHYKDWSYEKFMVTLKEVCETCENVYVSNFDLSKDDPLFRAFFLSFLIDINDFKNFNEVYIECGNICKNIIKIAENRLRGIWWLPEFEDDELLFQKFFLAPYFSQLKFEKVIYNHGNQEYGKDFILRTTNIFGEHEHYGVQAKAGNLSGSAKQDIKEIVNQINMAFEVPHKLIDKTEVFMSKVVIAISGYFTENAKERISRDLERYKFSSLIFLSKRELSSINISLIK